MPCGNRARRTRSALTGQWFFGRLGPPGFASPRKHASGKGQKSVIAEEVASLGGRPLGNRPERPKGAFTFLQLKPCLCARSLSLDVLNTHCSCRLSPPGLAARSASATLSSHLDLLLHFRLSGLLVLVLPRRPHVCLLAGHCPTDSHPWSHPGCSTFFAMYISLH